MYLSSLGTTGLISGSFCHSHRSDFPEDEADVCTKEKY